MSYTYTKYLNGGKPIHSYGTANRYTRLENLAWSHSNFWQFIFCRKCIFMKPLLLFSVDTIYTCNYNTECFTEYPLPLNFLSSVLSHSIKCQLRTITKASQFPLSADIKGLLNLLVTSYCKTIITYILSFQKGLCFFLLILCWSTICQSSLSRPICFQSRQIF